MIHGTAVYDRPQPTPEGIAGTILAEVRDPPRHRRKHVLEDILDISPIEPLAAQPEVHERPVEPHQLSPGVGIPASWALMRWIRLDDVEPIDEEEVDAGFISQYCCNGIGGRSTSLIRRPAYSSRPDS